MLETNRHIRCAKAMLASAAKRSFVNETLKGLLDEIDRLNNWADGFSDIHLKERRTGEEYQHELRAEIERLRVPVTEEPQLAMF